VWKFPNKIQFDFWLPLNGKGSTEAAAGRTKASDKNTLWVLIQL